MSAQTYSSGLPTLKPGPDFRTLVAHSSDIIAYFDDECRYVYVNPTLERLIGLPPSDFLGKRTAESVLPATPSTRAEWQQRLERVLRTGQEERFQVVMSATQGEQAFAMHYLPQMAADGSVTGIFAVGRNVTTQWQAEQAWQASTAFAQTILNSLPAHIAVLDQAGTIIAVNQAWEQFALANGGLTARTGVGQNYLAICRQASGEDAASALAAADGIHAVLTGTHAQFALEYPCHSPAQQRWFAFTATPLAGSAGGVVVTHLNITERKRAETTLRTSEERYRTLVEMSPDAIYINRQERLIYVNPAFVRLMGANSAQQLLGKSPFEIFHPDEHAIIQQRRQQLLAQNRPLPTIEQKIIQLDGTIKAVDVTAASYQDEEGSAFQVVLHDITNRKRAETALRESEERYRTLVEMSPDAITVYRENRIIYANPACLRKLAATSAAEVVGRSPFDFIHAAEWPEAQEHITRLLGAGGTSPKTETRFVRLDGVTIDVEVRATRIEDQGKIAIQNVWRDITARKQAEAETAKLLAEVTAQRTELRTLNRRLAETQALERKALARELHDQIGSNLSLLAVNLKLVENEHIAQLPVDALASSRFQELQGMLQQINQRIRDVMADLWPPVLDDYGLLAALEWYADRVASHSQLAITVQGDEPEPRPATEVEQALFRIAQEALTNVVKHAQASQVTIRLTAMAEQLRLEIGDNGRGIDPALLPRPNQGQGWGLLTMRERAEAVGGRWRIASRSGAGTTITVEIPVADQLSPATNNPMPDPGRRTSSNLPTFDRGGCE